MSLGLPVSPPFDPVRRRSCRPTYYLSRHRSPSRVTLADRLGLSDDREAVLTRALQGGLVVLAIYGVLAGRVGVSVNAVGALAVTLLPALLHREVGVRMDFGLVLWLAVATSLHAVGILGPYTNVWWWDHLTHALSASVVAGAAYATVDALDRSREGIDLPEPYRSVVLLAFVLATAVLWEVVEFGATRLSMVFGAKNSVLVIFGPKDIVTDIVYSAAGGLVVIAWGRGYFRDLSRKLSRAVFRGSAN